MRKYGKEIILVLITTIIVSVISVSATVYFNSENITFTPTDIDWNVTNTNAALNDLYSTATTKINNFKSTIATAITDMGVTTAEDADAETMANNIKSISSSSSSLTLVGTYTGNQTIDVSSVIKSNDTADNFILEFVGVPFNQGGLFSTGTERWCVTNSNTGIAKQLSGTKLTISNAVLTIGLAGNVGLGPGWNIIYTKVTYKVWHF